jgi:SAM-dependent methyltransferase
MISNSTLSSSRFWHALWREYPAAPSIVLCRVPELEYASRLNLNGATLDHCCGDARFAALAWPAQKFSAGFDLSAKAIEKAKWKQKHSRLEVADAATVLPYAVGEFDFVFNNSALEHIPDLDLALQNVSSVMSEGGEFVFNVLNHRYFEWWPLSQDLKLGYQRWQPFYHALSLTEWQKRLAAVGLAIIDIKGYFDRPAAQELARLDCLFSGVYIAGRRSMIVWANRYFPQLINRFWQRRFRHFTWETEADAGAGYFIKAIKQK